MEPTLRRERESERERNGGNEKKPAQPSKYQVMLKLLRGGEMIGIASKCSKLETRFPLLDLIK